MIELVIATYNRHKLKEICDILRNIDIRLLSLFDIGFTKKIPEKGNSFKENATLKAEFVGKLLNKNTLAEDSGFVVEALGGRPGIYSARYVSGSDTDRINEVLKELKGIPMEKRSAHFITQAALYVPYKEHTYITSGKTYGSVSTSSIGSNGFGYDSIFYSTELKKTFGEASREEKNSVSHRTIAIRKLIPKLMHLV